MVCIPQLAALPVEAKIKLAVDRTLCFGPLGSDTAYSAVYHESELPVDPRGQQVAEGRSKL